MRLPACDPTGVLQELTFLFADIEGSTRLVIDLGDRYLGVLGETRVLVRRAVEDAGGRVVDARGDEVFAVFETPEAGVAAAREAQRSLSAAPWPEDGVVRVRIGLNTGIAAEDQSHNLVGLEVNRAARVTFAGHGGQVLLSTRTAELVDAEMHDLGEYRLPGLTDPERIFQLVVPGQPDEFPPLRCGPRRRGLKVALADDSVILREGVARLLEEAGMEVVSQAGTPDELLLQVEEHKPDVAIVDIRMPPTGSDEGLRAAREIRRRFPEIGVLLLSQTLEPVFAVELIDGNPVGVGYLLKDRAGDLEEFAAAVHRVAEGGVALDPELVPEIEFENSE